MPKRLIRKTRITGPPSELKLFENIIMDCLGKAAGLLFVLFILAIGSMGGSRQGSGQAQGGGSGGSSSFPILGVLVVAGLMVWGPDLFSALVASWKNRRSKRVFTNNQSVLERNNDSISSVEHWMVGEWETLDSDGQSRGYVLEHGGAAKQHKLNGNLGTPVRGTYLIEPVGTVKLLVGTAVCVLRRTENEFTMTRWNAVGEYPEASKAVTGLVKKLQQFCG